ncbi:3-oxoacyl-ACP synthase III family protein [Spirillospora sp. NPDC048911]|uniref:3-oxoacyl-ACP synthase III family protein n=1 Tax=Spirillospora sp. NPDC048911 TaxID=3364527 RepID=UPI0037225CF7
MVNARITGIGSGLPEFVLSNSDLVKWHGHRDPQWIEERFGIRERRSCYDVLRGEHVTDEHLLCVDAGKEALEEAGLTADRLDALVLLTNSPMHVVFPDPACRLHDALGMTERAQALTVTAGCAGTLNGLLMAHAYISSELASSVLVVTASSALSAYAQPHLRERMWLFASIFGDGASALVVQAGRDDDTGLCPPFQWGTDAENDVAHTRFGGSAEPVTPANADEAAWDHPEFDFRKVPGNLDSVFTRLYEEARDAPLLDGGPPDWVLFNMSNGPTQRRWLQEQGIPAERSHFNIESVGNCGAASLGLLLHDFIRERHPQPGDLALLMSVGTGLQYASAFYRF